VCELGGRDTFDLGAVRSFAVARVTHHHAVAIERVKVPPGAVVAAHS